MKVILINPPFYFARELEYLTQNLGLGYLASTLIAAGHDVSAIDALAEGRESRQRIEADGRVYFRYGLPYDEIVSRIPSDVDMIGITAPFSNHARIIGELCSAIKQVHPKVPIVIGGVYPSAQPERAITGGADYAVVGEGETTLSALAAGLDPASVPGVWFKRDGEIIDGGRSEMVADLDSIPFPARDLLPMETYLTLSPRGNPGARTATMITSRGCPFACTFCSIHPVYTRKWRARSAGNILAEIDELVGKYGVDFIEFEDDNLTLDPDRAREIFRGLRYRPVKWHCANGLRVDSLDRDLLEIMKESGCTAVHLAIESGAPEMLEVMNKKLDLEKVKEVVRACLDLRLPIVGFFIVGHPGETEEYFRNTRKFVEELRRNGLENCGVHIATPYPGTRLLDLCKEKGYLIHPDAETRVMFPGDIHIETPDFDREKVLDRLYSLRTAAGTQGDFGKGLRGFIDWKLLPALSRWRLIRRLYPATMPESALDGFEPPTLWNRYLPMRKMVNSATMTVFVPPDADGIRFFASSESPMKVTLRLDGEPIGTFWTKQLWQVFRAPLFKNYDSNAVEANFLVVPAGRSEAKIRDGDLSELYLGWIEFTMGKNFLESMFPHKTRLAELSERQWKGFHEAEKAGRFSYRWSHGEARLDVHIPPRGRTLELMAGSNRSHTVEVFLDDIKLGNMPLQGRAERFKFRVPQSHRGGEHTISFRTKTFVPSRDGDSGDNRQLGFMLSWYRFLLFL